MASTAAKAALREGPILFTTDMVDAVRRQVNPKSRTRRVINDEWFRCLDPEDPDDRKNIISQCPYGLVGDRLWVRESWRVGSSDRDSIWYRDETFMKLPDSADNLAGKALGDKWKPSIHMYRWASRQDLLLARVRFERLQSITESEAKAEGVLKSITRFGIETKFKSHVEAFRELWDELNYDRGFGWEANPWVWVLTFARLNK